MFLHAAKLALPHPLTGVPLELESPLPEDLRAFVEKLDRNETGTYGQTL